MPGYMITPSGAIVGVIIGNFSGGCTIQSADPERANDSLLVCEYCDSWCEEDPCEVTGKIMAPHDQCNHWELVDSFGWE